LSVITVAVAVSAVSAYSVIQSMILAGGLVSVTSLLGKYFDRMEVKNLLKKNVESEIAVNRSRLSRMEDGSLRDELQAGLGRMKDSLNERFKNEEDAIEVFKELNALRKQISEVELDDSQCRTRAEAVRSLIASLKEAGVASYETELERLEGELEKVGELSLDERMFELQGILEELREMDAFKDLASDVDLSALQEKRYVFAPAPGRNRSEESSAVNLSSEQERLWMVREIRDWADRVAQIDEAEGRKLRPLIENLKADTPFPDRLVQLRRQLRTTWGAIREKAVLAEFFRESLTDLMNAIRDTQNLLDSGKGLELVRRYDALCGQKCIERADAMELYEDMARFVRERDKEIEDALLVSRLERTLGELGYELLTDELFGESGELGKPNENSASAGRPGLRRGEVRYLDSPYEGYRVMLKVDSNGAVTTRLVRVVESAEERDSTVADQSRKDREVGKKWCSDFDKFLEKMKTSGLPLDVSLRKEPDEVDILAVMDNGTGCRKKSRNRRLGTAENRQVRGVLRSDEDDAG
jgi:hypothetical protein